MGNFLAKAKMLNESTSSSSGFHNKRKGVLFNDEPDEEFDDAVPQRKRKR